MAYNADAMLVLPDMPDGSVDLIVTDPPYGTGGNTVSARIAPSSSKYSFSNTHLPDIAGDSVLPETWNEMMRTVMEHLLRVAVQGAYALLFCDWRAYPQLLRIATFIGWMPCGLLVWDKGRGTRPRKNGFRAQTEFILWLRKGQARQRNDSPVYLDGVFRHATPPRLHHLTEKPVELMYELLGVGRPGEHVLDPFQGSGTTGVAAIRRGMRYTGIELVRYYHDVAVQRLRSQDGACQT